MGRKIPMNKPKGLDILQIRIKTILAQQLFTQWPDFKIPVFFLLATFAASTQNLIARAICLPTPKVTIASSMFLNKPGRSSKMLTALGSQGYLQGKVSCPVNLYFTIMLIVPKSTQTYFIDFTLPIKD